MPFLAMIDRPLDCSRRSDCLRFGLTPQVIGRLAPLPQCLSNRQYQASWINVVSRLGLERGFRRSTPDVVARSVR